MVFSGAQTCKVFFLTIYMTDESSKTLSSKDNVYFKFISVSSTGNMDPIGFSLCEATIKYLFFNFFEPTGSELFYLREFFEEMISKRLNFISLMRGKKSKERRLECIVKSKMLSSVFGEHFDVLDPENYDLIDFSDEGELLITVLYEGKATMEQINENYLQLNNSLEDFSISREEITSFYRYTGQLHTKPFSEQDTDFINYELKKRDNECYVEIPLRAFKEK